MQTLMFNTKDKTVVLYKGSRDEGTIIEKFKSVPTVKVSPDGFYEVMAKPNEDSNAIPVMRIPIANTNMIIVS